MNKATLLGALLASVVALPALANEDPYIEIIHGSPKPQLEVSPLEVFEAEGPLTVQIEIGTVYSALKKITSDFLPGYKVVWDMPHKQIFQPMVLSGETYDDLIIQVIKNYGVAACIRANSVVEMYDVKRNKYHCE